MSLFEPTSRARVWLAGAALTLTALAAVPVHAGRTCEVRKTTTQTVERSLALAGKTLAALNASGAKVVILARAGQDLTTYKLRYSHVGLAFQQPDGQGGTTWRVMHKLNECGTANSAVYLQGLGEFFLDDVWRYEAAFQAPTPEVQARLLTLLQNPTPGAALGMHHQPYSMVSYAWGRKYQQSNQWAIETLAAAMEPTILATGRGIDGARTSAQAWLQFKGYEPTALKIGPVTRLGGRATAANIAFDDHPNDKRFSDRIETVTADSIFEWMTRAQLAPVDPPLTVVGL